ncbi:MAG: hypothetical protein AAGD10_20340, partial [Myxococcota bacterium]
SGPGPGEAGPTHASLSPSKQRFALFGSARCASLRPLRGLRSLRPSGPGPGEAVPTRASLSPSKQRFALFGSARCASLRPLRLRPSGREGNGRRS